jgi:hypothetical protein
MEAARALCAVIRVLQATPTTLEESWQWGVTDTETESKDVPSESRARFYTAHTAPITKTLGFMLRQSKFCTLRSEAIFVLALMARSVDGGRLAVRVLDDAEACRALVHAVTGKEASDDDLGVGRVEEVVEPGEEKGKEVAPSVDTGLVDGLGLEPQQADAKQSAKMARVDRENGLVLVAEITRGFSDELSPARKKLFKGILSQGGEMILEERKISQAVE